MVELRLKVAEYDPLETVEGLIVAFRLNELLTKRSTESVKPPEGVRVTVDVVVVPAVNVTGDGLAESEKSGPVTVTPT